jgi:hypothetical protein
MTAIEAESGEAVVVYTPLLLAAPRADHWFRGHYIAADHQVWVASASSPGQLAAVTLTPGRCSGIWKSDGVLVAQAGPESAAIARATLG